MTKKNKTQRNREKRNSQRHRKRIDTKKTIRNDIFLLFYLKYIPHTGFLLWSFIVLKNWS
jgi:hypothetical protein